MNTKENCIQDFRNCYKQESLLTRTKYAVLYKPINGNIAKPCKKRELSQSDKEQEIMVLAWIITPHLCKEDSLHSFHQEDSHAQTGPRHQKVVRVTHQNPSEYSQAQPCESIPTICHHVKQWCLTTTQGKQCYFQKCNLHKPAKQSLDKQPV